MVQDTTCLFDFVLFYAWSQTKHEPILPSIKLMIQLLGLDNFDFLVAEQNQTIEARRNIYNQIWQDADEKRDGHSQCDGQSCRF